MTRPFNPSAGATSTTVQGYIKIIKKVPQETEKRINIVSFFFNFCEIDYVSIIWPRTPSFWRGQSSLCRSTDFGLSTKKWRV